MRQQVTLKESGIVLHAAPQIHLDGDFHKDVKKLVRPYTEIPKGDYDALMQGGHDVYLMNGRLVTFGNADGGYALMPMAMPELWADAYLIQDGYGYRDVDVYVKGPADDEWLIRIYKDHESGSVTVVGPRYSLDCDGEFQDEGLYQPPAEVLAAVEKIRSVVNVMLAGYMPYQVSYKEDAGDKSTMVFECWARNGEDAIDLCEEAKVGDEVLSAMELQSPSEFSGDDVPYPVAYTASVQSKINEATVQIAGLLENLRAQGIGTEVWSPTLREIDRLLAPGCSMTIGPCKQKSSLAP